MPGSSNGGERPLRPIPVSRSLPAIAGGYDWLDEIPDVTVCGITLDSRSVLPGDLYCALPGANTHGARFAAEAVSRGCVAASRRPCWPSAPACRGRPGRGTSMRPCGACPNASWPGRSRGSPSWSRNLQRRGRPSQRFHGAFRSDSPSSGRPTAPLSSPRCSAAAG